MHGWITYVVWGIVCSKRSQAGGGEVTACEIVDELMFHRCVDRAGNGVLEAIINSQERGGWLYT